MAELLTASWRGLINESVTGALNKAHILRVIPLFTALPPPCLLSLSPSVVLLSLRGLAQVRYGRADRNRPSDKKKQKNKKKHMGEERREGEDRRKEDKRTFIKWKTGEAALINNAHDLK